MTPYKHCEEQIIPQGNNMLHPIRLAMLGFCALLISACDSQNEIQIQGNTIATPLPDKIRQVSNLGTLPIEIQVTVNGVRSAQVRVPENAIGSIMVTANVPADQTNDVTVEWLAIPNGTRVLLADFSTVTQPNQQEVVVSAYNDTGERFDFDGDGLSNLDEARANRNILGVFDLEVPRQETFLGPRTELIPGSIDPDISGDITDADTNSTFSLRHDSTNLILYVCGQDEVLQGDGTDTNADAYWHDDTIFVYLDGADSDATTYDNIDDFQFAFVRSTEEMIVSKGGNNQFCANDPIEGSCVTHSFNPAGPSSLCEYELRVNMPLAELNMTIGESIGFDLEITDDDNGGEREGSSGFVGFDDRSDLDPSSFGKIILR